MNENLSQWHLSAAYQGIRNTLIHKRFSLESLFSKAETQLIDGCHYLIMSLEQRRAHLVYHSYLNDGFKARYDLPLRAACGYLHLKPTPKAKQSSNIVFFEQLIKALLQDDNAAPITIKRHMTWLERGYKYNICSMLLNIKGKLQTAFSSVRHNPQILHKPQIPR